MAGDHDLFTVDSIESSGRKKTVPLWSYGDEIVEATAFYNKELINSRKAQIAQPIDSTSSAQPLLPSASASPTVVEKVDPNKSTSIFQRVWNYLNTPISYGPVEAEGSVQTNAPKPAAMNGTPLLDAPYQIDVESLQKLIKELREMIYQIKEISNETEDELVDKDRLMQSTQSLRLLIDSLKTQKNLRDEGSAEMKFKVIFQIKAERKLRKEIYESDGERIEANKSRQFWGNVNTVASTATIVVTIGLFALTGVAMAMTQAPSIATFLAGTRMTLQISQMATATSSAVTSAIKAKFDKVFGEKKEVSTNLTGKYRELQYNINLDNEALQSGVNRGGKVAEWLFQVLKNDREAARSMNSR